MPTAEDIIRLLGLAPHPEGGHFRETFRDPLIVQPSGRAASTAIYYLLREGERSDWHRVDASEVWHWYAGAPLELLVERTRHLLGPVLADGMHPQAVVPAHAWQSARSLGTWTLAGCTVAPGFDFAGFELAPLGFDPAR